MSATGARLHIGMTDTGRVLLGGTGFVFLAAVIIPAFGVLSALVCVLLMALIIGFILRPRIRMTGDLPDRLVAGQTTQLTYQLKNVGRLPAYNLNVAFRALPATIEQTSAADIVARLRPGRTTEVMIAIRPKRRGHCQIAQPMCHSSFPFNLFSFGTSRDDRQTLTVMPAFSRLQIPLQRLGRHVTTAGGRRFGRTGASTEYAGNRPFMPGDSPRNIDSRAWARLAAPATKEYHDDLDNYTALILDTRIPQGLSFSNLREIKEIEAAVSLCASIAFTINRDCWIDLLLAGSDLHQFDAWPRPARLDRIHDILAGIEPSKGYSTDSAVPILTDRFYQISEAVFILLHWDSTYRHLLERADNAGCHCTVLLIGDPGTTDLDQHHLRRAANIHFLSPDGILTGRVKRL